MNEKLQALTLTFNHLDLCHRYIGVDYDLYQPSWEGDPFWTAVGDSGFDENCYEGDHYVDLYWFTESEREQVWNGATYVYATHPKAVSLNS